MVFGPYSSSNLFVPRLGKQSLTAALPQFVKFRDFSSILRLGLIALEGPKWQQTHHFSYNSFKPRLTAQDLDKVMLEQVNNVVNAFKKEKGSFNPDEYLYSANVNILSYIMFGRSLNYLGTEFHAVTKGLFDAFDAIAGGLIQQ